MTAAARLVPRGWRARAFVAVLVAGVLLGGGLRLVPWYSIAQGAASTACAAT